MRNLKRALSLGLTAAMISGLMVMGSSAASYADVTSEDNVEAIEVLQTVGIMVGDENGDFNPDQNVTRNEMAVIMSNLMEYNVASYKDTSPFTDVPSWAEPYVAACWTNGITAGTSATTYGGSDTVTTAQAALMLMKALGYFQYASDFGSDWQLATTRQGNDIDLFVGVDSGVTQAMTRNDVAQLVLNTLKSGTVQASTDGSWTIGNVTVNNNVKYNYVTSNQSYATAIDDARSTSSTTDAGRSIVELGEQLYMGDLKLNDDATDVFGRPARYWEYDGDEIGTYAKTELLRESYTTKVTGKDLYDLLGSNIVDTYDFDVTIDGVSDYDINNAIFDETSINRNNKAKVGDTGNGVLTEVYVDTDARTVDIAIINTYLAKADKDYDEKKDELDIYAYGLQKTGDEYVKVIDDDNNKNKDDKERFTLDGEDFDVSKAVEDDFFLVTVADGEVQTIAKPEIVADAEISAFKIGSNVTVDGTKYDYSDSAEYDFEVLDQYTDNKVNLKDLTYNVYLDQYGYAIGVDLVETPNNYVFITGIDSNYSAISSKTLDANAIFLDGTSKVIEVKGDKGNLPSYIDAALVNKWCTYTVDKDGIYTLTEVASKIDTDNNVKVAQYADEDHDTIIDKKHTSLPGSNGGSFSKVYGNDASVYLTASIKEIATAPRDSAIVIDGVDSVTTGLKNANIQPWDQDKAFAEGDNAKISGATKNDTASGVYTLYKSNGYIIASVVVGEDAAASKNLVYVHSSDVEQEGYDKTADEWTWTRKVISDGKEIEIKEVGDALTYLDSMKQYCWYQVKYNAEGEIIGVMDEDASGYFDKWSLNANEYVTNIKDVETAINEEDTVLYTQPFTKDQPSMKGSTLFVSTKDKTGFFVAEDVNITLIQTVKNKQETTFETGVDNLEDIVNDLNTANGKYNYTISAILEDGAATSVVIYDRSNDYSKPDLPESNPGEFLPASWDKTANGGKGAIVLRYYDKPMSDSELKDAIADMLGEPVDRLNKLMGYVVMENGDMYPVDFDQIEVIAIKINDEIVAYTDKGTEITVKGIAVGDYMDIIANKSGVSNKVSSVGNDGELRFGSKSNTQDREFVSAYQVTGITSNVTAALDDKDETAVSDNDYVAEGKTLVLTFTKDTGDYTVNGDLVRTNGKEKDVIYVIDGVSETVKVEVAQNYMDEDQLEQAIDGEEGNFEDATNATVNYDPDSNKLTVTLNKGTSIDQIVGDMGLYDAVVVLNKGNNVSITFEDGTVVNFKADKLPERDAFWASLATGFTNNSTLPTEITVEFTNVGSGESASMIVVIAEAKD